jgi:heat shock protein HslJ
VRRHSLALALSAVLLAVLAGCASRTSGAPGWPTGRTFIATKVTENGHDRPLFPGTQLMLRFEATDIVAGAGCNTLDVRVSVSGDRISVTEQATTLMGCLDGRAEQDAWMTDFFTAGPTWHLAGDQLTLATATTVIELLDQRVAEPHPIIGTRWMVTGQFDRQTASALPPDKATVEFTSDSTVVATTGCATLTGPAFITEVSYPTMIDVNPLKRVQRAPCPPDLIPLDAAVTRTLAGQLTTNVQGRTLTLTTVDGTGLTLVAS